MHIAKTGKVELLKAKNGIEAWEQIVSKNANVNGSDEYSNYMNLTRSYALTINEYIMVKASITKLSIKVDNKLIEYLIGKGYKINTSTNDSYVESLNKASSKCENLRTRINMKKNEIGRIVAMGGKQQDQSLEQVLASLSYQIGFPIADDITLSRFNEYCRIIKIKEQNGRA